MNDRAVIGGNNPPDPIDALTVPFEDDRAEAENWLDGTAIQTEEQMAAVDVLRGSMRQWRLGLERGQKEATAPLHDIYKREMDRWKPTIADAKRIEDGLVSLGAGLKAKLAAEKEAARKEAEKRAWEATRAAQEAARIADASNIEATRAAAHAMAEADAAQSLAMAAAKDTVKGMRLVWRYEITDARAALHWIAKNDRDAITAFVEDYVRRNHRDKVIDGVNAGQAKEAY